MSWVEQLHIGSARIYGDFIICESTIISWIADGENDAHGRGKERVSERRARLQFRLRVSRNYASAARDASRFGTE